MLVDNPKAAKEAYAQIVKSKRVAMTVEGPDGSGGEGTFRLVQVCTHNATASTLLHCVVLSTWQGQSSQLALWMLRSHFSQHLWVQEPVCLTAVPSAGELPGGHVCIIQLHLPSSHVAMFVRDPQRRAISAPLVGLGIHCKLHPAVLCKLIIAAALPHCHLALLTRILRKKHVATTRESKFDHCRPLRH